MKKQNKNITALPEPTEKFSLGSDTSALSSGSAIFNLREYGGSVSNKLNVPSLMRKVNTWTDIQLSNPLISAKSILVIQGAGSYPAIPYLKITRPKQFPVVSQKWSMEKLTTSTQNFLHCPSLTTGNLDGKQITNLKKMSHAIMEPDSYFLQNVNELIHFSQNRALTSIKRNARETTALNQL